MEFDVINEVNAADITMAIYLSSALSQPQNAFSMITKYAGTEKEQDVVRILRRYADVLAHEDHQTPIHALIEAFEAR